MYHERLQCQHLPASEEQVHEGLIEMPVPPKGRREAGRHLSHCLRLNCTTGEESRGEKSKGCSTPKPDMSTVLNVCVISDYRLFDLRPGPPEMLHEKLP